MSDITITINTDNAAFDDGRGGASEVARILATLVDLLGRERAELIPGDQFILRDINGNTVGDMLVGGDE